MKKENKLILVGLLFLAFLVSCAVVVYAQDEVPGLPSGFDEVPGAARIEQGQQTYEQYTTAENKSAYLAEQWGLLIGKSAFIGPIHNFLSSNQLLFKIFFNYPYELSFAFFFVLVLWFTFVFKMTKIVKSMDLVLIKKSFTLPFVLILTIILAQLHVFNLIVRGIVNLMFLSDAWWVRIIVFVLICTVIVALSIFSNYLSKYFKTQAELKKQQELEQTSEEFKAFEKGVKEGQELTK